MTTTAKLLTAMRIELATWEDFFELANHTAIPLDFMDDRDDLPAEERNLFCV